MQDYARLQYLLVWKKITMNFNQKAELPATPPFGDVQSPPKTHAGETETSLPLARFRLRVAGASPRFRPARSRCEAEIDVWTEQTPR